MTTMISSFEKEPRAWTVNASLNNTLARWSTIVIAMLFALITIAQSGGGTLKGTVTDKKSGETLIGTVVKVDGTTLGVSTDLDGGFDLRNVPPGTYTVRFNMIGYAVQAVSDVVISEGKTTQLNTGLLEATAQLAEVQVTAKANRESSLGLMNDLRDNSAIAVGVSQEQIKRSPDKNVGEVLKRASGVSVQDNKFVVVRGLADRYNTGMLNGMPLSSTEPDRKAIGFDLFPSNAVQSVVITKTATPDLPGEFAGGVVQINTKEIPDKNTFSVALSTGLNSQSTFKNYASYPKGGSDWLGLADGSRTLPSGFPSTQVYNNIHTTLQQRGDYSTLFPNTWKVSTDGKMLPNVGLQVAGSRRVAIGAKNSFGALGSVTYSNYRRYVEAVHNDYNYSANANVREYQFAFNDKQYSLNTFVGGLLDFGLNLGENNTISLKNIVGINGKDMTTLREGTDNQSGSRVRANSAEFTSTSSISNQFQVKHKGREWGDDLRFGLSRAQVQREVPDLRKMVYQTATLDPGDSAYYAEVPGSPTPSTSGRYFGHLLDVTWTGALDYRVPIKKDKHYVKTGVMYNTKNRDYWSRVLGYTHVGGQDPAIDQLLYTPNIPQEELFRPENIGYHKITIGDITRANDAYTADQTVMAGYVMLDDRIAKKLRVIWGVRYEIFDQNLHTLSLTLKPLLYNNHREDVLPSVNLICELSDRHTIRAAISRTVARPEMRELSANAYYDFTSNYLLQGNPLLVPGTMDNYDLRYEFYPSSGQLISVGAFYKKFTDPIEQIFLAANTRIYSYHNQLLGAFDRGVELELRVKLSSIPGLDHAAYLDNITLFGNAAWIESEVDQSNEKNVSEPKRPLQGQSPYVINGGLDLRDAKRGIGFTVLFNRIGERIAYVGDGSTPDIKERPRSVLDVQVMKTLIKDKGEVRLTAGDVLNNPAVFYQDLDHNNRYDEKTDYLMQRFLYGVNWTVAFSWKF